MNTMCKSFQRSSNGLRLLYMVAWTLVWNLTAGEAVVPKADPKADPPKVDPVVVAPAAAPAAEAVWQKIDTKFVQLPQPKQVLSPGIFDTELQNTLTFTKDPAGVDTNLPHAGKDKNGKAYPAIIARLAQGVIWVDLNGDGKPQPEETKPVNPESGWSDVFTTELHYEDGTSGQYSFRFKQIVENEKFALVRAGARTLEFQGQKLVLLDDNGNGKYDDVDKDAVLIGDGPAAFLGKYVNIGGEFYEMLAHESGSVVEIRPAPKQGVPVGMIDLFRKYKPPQKAETLKIHTIIVSGPEGSFAFDERHKEQRVPAGAYDIVFGLFERAKETVYMKKGEKTSFTVTAEKVSTPAWGGEVKATFELKQDVPPEPKAGAKPEPKPDPNPNAKPPEPKIDPNIWVGTPSFVGEGSERYFAENFRVVPVQASVARVYTERQKVDRKEPVGSRRYEVLPNGDVKPLTFKVQPASAEYEVAVTYNSGIMGSVEGRQRFQYVMRKKPEKKP